MNKGHILGFFDLMPKEEHVYAWMLHSVQHSLHAEYFFHALNVGGEDPQRPHDLVGLGNKLEWATMRHYAVQAQRHPLARLHLNAALESHRRQYHHLNGYAHEGDSFVPGSRLEPVDHAKVRAVDAICSLLENRAYNGGAHTYDEIAAMKPPIDFSNNLYWSQRMLEAMIPLPQPDLTVVRSLDDIPNVGVPASMHARVKDRVDETRLFLKRDLGYTNI